MYDVEEYRSPSSSTSSMMHFCSLCCLNLLKSWPSANVRIPCVSALKSTVGISEQWDTYSFIRPFDCFSFKWIKCILWRHKNDNCTVHVVCDCNQSIFAVWHICLRLVFHIIQMQIFSATFWMKSTRIMHQAVFRHIIFGWHSHSPKQMFDVHPSGQLNCMWVHNIFWSVHAQRLKLLLISYATSIIKAQIRRSYALSYEKTRFMLGTTRLPWTRIQQFGSSVLCCLSLCCRCFFLLLYDITHKVW